MTVIREKMTNIRAAPEKISTGGRTISWDVIWKMKLLPFTTEGGSWRENGEGEGLICGCGNLMLIKSEECHIQTLESRSPQRGSGSEGGGRDAFI